jgi:photosystem II stability/assembly factor-like uncharacterized protein
VAVGGSIPIYYSSDYGRNWYQSASVVASWVEVAMSENGQYVAALINSGIIYLSSDFGHTFVPSTAANTQFVSVGIDASGTYMVASTVGAIYHSNTFGSSWVVSTFRGSLVARKALCMSHSGQYVTVASSDVSTSTIFYSYDYGHI